MKRFMISAVVMLGVAAAAMAGNWPAWRGPEGTGISTEQGLPTEWSETENVTWKVKLPDEGNSTPIVWEDRVFVTGPIANENLRTLMCFDRADGKLLWQQAVKYDEPESTHKTNPYCSASPVTDGERVIVWHGSAGMLAYDFEGNELWRRDFGKFDHIWGNAASPVIYGDLVIAHLGPGLNVALVALDKRTGKDVWTRDLPEAESKTAKQYFGSWSTPILRDIGGKTELLVSMPGEIRAFDPQTGTDLWRCGGLTDLVYTSVLTGGDVVVAMSGYGGSAIAVRAPQNSRDDLTDSSQLWRVAKNPQRVGSGVVVGDHVYILNAPGIAECIELTTGESVWEKRLGGDSWSSMAYADGRLYAINMDGETFVLAAEPEFKLISRNPLEPAVTTRASLAFSDGQIFIRTYEHLYCIGQRRE